MMTRIPRPAAGPGGGVPRRLAALAAKLARLRAAEDKLAEAAGGAPARRPPGSPPPGRRPAVPRRGGWPPAEAAQAAKMAQVPGRGGRREGLAVRQETRSRPARTRGSPGSARTWPGRRRPGWPRPRAAAAAAPVKVSATDPDSRLLPAKNGGGCLQGWNLQLTAARRQVLLAVELHDNPADAGALAAMIAAAVANCELAGLAGRIRAWLADNGYASAATFPDLDHLMLLVAVRNEAAQAGRGAGRATPPPGWEKMAARLATPAGKKLYKRRAALVEPAFAQFFARFGRYVNYRGRDAVDAEIKLLAAVHNLAKLLDHRRRHPALAT